MLVALDQGIFILYPGARFVQKGLYLFNVTLVATGLELNGRH
jgi:hypothetical protein